MRNIPFIALVFLFLNTSAVAQGDIKVSELDCFTWGKPAAGTDYWTFLEQKGINIGATHGDRNIRNLIAEKELVVFNNEICLRWVKLDQDPAYEFWVMDGEGKTFYNISSLGCGVRLRPSQFLNTDSPVIRVLMAKKNERSWGSSYYITPMSNEEQEGIIKEIEKLPRLAQPQAAIGLADFFLSKDLVIDALTVLENQLKETPDEAIINKYWEIMATARDRVIQRR